MTLVGTLITLGALLLIDYSGTGQAAPSSSDPARLTGMRLLLVEDNPVNQLVAQAMLEGAGGSVSVAEDGRVAIERIDRDPPYDAVLTDLQIPEMDGYEATGLLRQR